MTETVIQLVAAQIGCSEDDLSIDTNLIRDLEIDSLDMVAIVSAIEDAFCVTIEDREVETLASIRAICDLVQARLA